MFQNPRKRTPKFKPPASVEAPKWTIDELKRALNRTYEGDNPGSSLSGWNERLRDQKHGVYVPFPAAYQGRATVQVETVPGLRARSGDAVLPLVAYVVTAGTSFNVPLSNALLYVKWEPYGTERNNLGDPRSYLVVTEVATERPNLEAGMDRLRERFGSDMKRNPRPNRAAAPPSRRRPPAPPRPGAAPPPARRGPAILLSSVRRLIADSDPNQPFDPERFTPHGVKPHHFAVNPSSSRTPSQQFADMVIKDRLLEDPEVLAEVYLQPPSPSKSILDWLADEVREGLSLKKSDIGDSAGRVCWIGQSMIVRSEVTDEIKKQLPALLKKAKREAMKYWPDAFDASGNVSYDDDDDDDDIQVPSRSGKVALLSLQDRILEVFDSLDRATGGRNYVTLLSIREVLHNVPRSQLDAAINDLRREWVVTLDPAEGRHERVSLAVLDAGIVEGESNLVYMARRDQD